MESSPSTQPPTTQRQRIHPHIAQPVTPLRLQRPPPGRLCSAHLCPCCAALSCARSDAGAALETRWQLKVKEVDSALRRASFEVTTEGTLRTRSFAIGKTGFHRTSDISAHQAMAHTATSPAAAHIPSTSLPVPPADRPHLDISEATILEMGLLGRGAGGKVLKSIHRPSLTLVALKCIDVGDKGKRAQLLKELKELDAAYCPHIVAFYGAYYHDLTCTVKLGLEYMNRGSLQSIVHQHGAIHELALTHLVKQALQGLLHLHSHRKLHRDIKPGNLLANHFGCAKLSDFGILAELNSSLAKCGTFVGTTIYMSPERLTSEAYSYPADVWSLGMTIITMATGAFPLSTDNGYWGLVMHFNTQPPPTLPDTFSPQFRDFIARCMVKEPAKRWAVKELLQHPWIVLGCEAEEALTYWPADARMFEPDPAVVKKQREERLERARKWEEAEERKKARKGLRQRASAVKEQMQAEERKEATDAAGDANDEEDGSGRLRHRRKAAITTFHPVGLLHLQAEAHVQNTRGKPPREEEKTADSLYGDGSDDEEEERRGGSEAAPGLTARSRKALAAQPSGGRATAAAMPAASTTATSATSSTSTLPNASRPRQLSVAKSSSAEQVGQEGVDRATPLMPLNSPKRGGSFLAAPPAPLSTDFNPLSPTRAARHNLKFLNGQVVVAPQHSASPSIPPTPTQPSLPLASISQLEPLPLSKVDSAHTAPSFTLPSVQGAPPLVDPFSAQSTTASPPPTLPALTRYNSSGSPVQQPSSASSASGSPSFSAAVLPGARARLQGLVPLSLDPSSRERSQTGASSSATVSSGASTLAPPLPSAAQPLSAALPAVHRSAPGLHRRSPSLPAAAVASPAPLSSSASPAVPSSPHAPHTPQAPIVDPQRRGLRARRPSAISPSEGGAPLPAIPSSRAVIKLPALQTTATVEATPATAAQSPTTPVDASDSQRDSGRAAAAAAQLPAAPQKGMRRRMSSISATLASSDLPPVTPVHLRAFSTAAPFTSPLLPLPLSPRSARLLSLISQAELDDAQIIVQALLDRYREREQTERDAERREREAQQPAAADDSPQGRASDSDESSPGSSHSSPPLPHLQLASSRSSAGAAALMDASDSARESGLMDSASGRCTPPAFGGGWPTWLPDEAALQEDLDRVADQLGIRVTLIAHTLRKILAAAT